MKPLLKLLSLLGVYTVGLLLGDYACGYYWEKRVFKENENVARPLEGTIFCPRAGDKYCGYYKQVSIKYGEYSLLAAEQNSPVYIPLEHGYVVTIDSRNQNNKKLATIGISNHNVRGHPFLLEFVSKNNTEMYDAFVQIKNNNGKIEQITNDF